MIVSALPGANAGTPFSPAVSLTGVTPGAGATSGTVLSSSASSPAAGIGEDSGLAALDAAVSRSSATHAATPAAVTPALRPIPATSMGTFSGYVNDSVNHTGIAGVQVQAFSKYQNCAQQNCTVTTTKTNPQGYFQVNALVGYDYITFTLNCWMTNITWATLSLPGQNVYVGTVYLTEDGFVNGTVRADMAGTPPVNSVHVLVSSRDTTFNGPATVYTNSKGQFNICSPVAPSKLDLQPQFNYMENWTWIAVASGAHLDLGTIYLQPEVLYKATLYDRVTGKTVSMNSNRMGAMLVCARDGSAYAGVCGKQGPTLGSGPYYRSGSTLYAYGPIGPVYAEIDVAGYVANYTEIATVTKAAYGHTFCLGSVNGSTCGKIYLTPIGVYNLRVDVERNQSTPLPWGTGLWRVTDCGLDGYDFAVPKFNPVSYTYNMTENTCVSTQGCAPVGGTASIAALPLRNAYVVEPDYTPACSFAATWPVPGPGLMPVWGTHGWVNATSGKILPNTLTKYLIPGDYLQGNVSLIAGGSASNAGTFTITATSTDYQNMWPASYSYTWAGTGSPSTSPWDCTGSQSARNFCAPVPPGNSQLQIVSSGNLPTNWTWVSGPRSCCSKLSNNTHINNASYPEWLGNSNVLHSGALNFGLGNDTVVGNAVIRGTSVTPGFGSVTVCPALPISNFYACSSGPLFTNGTFRMPGAAPGWDYITVTASGYTPNTIWAYVSGYTNVGTVSVVPVATLYGRVLGADGQPVVSATVQYCTADNTLQCTLGSGTKLAVQTATDGSYNGSVPGGWLPWATYLIAVSAPGYTTDWAWVNATPGNFTPVPDITLWPVINGSSNSTASRLVPAPSATGIIWIDGRVSDGFTGLGVYQAKVQACPTNLGGCTSFSDGTNSYGEFNGSVIPGTYNLEVSQPGYPTLSIGFTASKGPTLHLGNSTMSPGGWVSGEIQIAPLEWNLSGTAGLGPGLMVQACDNIGTNCGGGSRVITAGAYNISVPFTGATGIIKFGPGPIGGAGGMSPATYGSAGFYAASAGFTLTGRYSTANNGTPSVAYIFGEIEGRVLELTPVGSVHAPPFGVRYATLSVTTYGGPLGNAGVSLVADGQGYYSVFLPQGNSSNAVTIQSAQYSYDTRTKQYNDTICPWGSDNLAPNSTLRHDGWVDFNVTALDVAAPYVGGTASTLDLLTGGTVGGPPSSSNQDGIMNLSAPVGSPVNVSLLGNGYNGTTFTAGGVNSSATTWAAEHNVSAWGLVRSEDVNSSGKPIYPVIGAIYDAAKGWPLPGAGVTAAASDGTTTGQTIDTNWNGQFLTDAPIGKADQLSVVHTAYAKNTSVLTAVSPGASWVVPRINLTGAGILGGRVFGYPGHIALAGVTITSCPKGVTAGAGCYSTTSNESGVFWVDASAGVDSLVFDADGYVSNSTTVVQVCSDCWIGLAPTALYAYATVTGAILGLPAGTALVGATANLCSPIGVPYGPCSVNSTTNSTGQFVLAAPPGPYVLVASATGYNSTYFPLSLLPGESVDVGFLFLEQYGTLVGAVYSTMPSAPLLNATVLACPTWSTGGCLPTVRTNALGQFSISGPPGTYSITFSYPGYSDGFLGAAVTAGTTHSLPTIYLSPLGNGTRFTISGHVLSGASGGGPVSGATISALSHGSLVASTQSSASGDFSLGLFWGDYTVQAWYSGFQAVSRNFTVHQSFPGTIFVLPPMTYNLSGTIRDGVTGDPLAGVTVALNGTELTTSDASGAYAIALANGTYTFQAYSLAGGAAGLQYASVLFTVAINGAPVTRDISMYPPTSSVNGLVVDEFSGLPLSQATVAVQGISADDQSINLTMHPDVSGRVSFSLPAGNYHLTASAPGYDSRVALLNATGEPLAVTVSLAPSGPGGAASAASDLAVYALLGLVVAFGLLLLTVLLRRRPNARRPPAARVASRRPAPARRVK